MHSNRAEESTNSAIHFNPTFIYHYSHTNFVFKYCTQVGTNKITMFEGAWCALNG
jgi:hypothetical protein